MVKKIILYFLVLLLLISTCVCASAAVSDAPSLILTEEQKEYFSERKALRVLTAPSTQPYAYQNTGVSIEILQRLCDVAGVELALIEAESYADALVRLEKGEGELAAVKIAQPGETEGIFPYIEAPLQVIFHKQAHLPKLTRLSLVQLQEQGFGYDEKYSFVEGMELATVGDCLDAVRARQADIFLCDIYQLSVYAESFAARDLKVTNLPQHSVTVGFGLGKNPDERLVSALQGAVDSFSTSEMNSMLIRHEQTYEMGFRAIQFIYENPVELLCAAVSLFFVILLCLFVFFKIRTRQHQELKGYEESYRMLANTFGEVGLEYDFLNDRLTVFGGKRDRIDLPEAVEQVHEELAKGTLRLSLTPEELDELLQNNEPNHSYEVELQCGMKEGNWNWFRMIYIVVCTSESHRRPIRLIGCFVDIEDEHQEKQRLLKMGKHDQLTGLLSRWQGEDEMRKAIDGGDEQQVLLFLDVDYFKNFNDCHGHSCGDVVLSTLGEAIRETFSAEDVLCRWGGDEFLLLVQGQRAQSDNLKASLEKLQNHMQAFTYAEEALPVTLSIGGAAVTPGISLQSLFELADAALYTVKNKGRNHFWIAYPNPDSHLQYGEEME